MRSPRVVLVALAVVGCAQSARHNGGGTTANAPSANVPSAINIDPRDAALSELAFPRTPVAPATKPEGHLARTVCAGTLGVHAPPRPRKMACCYPDKELIVRPIRSVFPALRACYDARKNADAEGRVVFDFRIEQSGLIERVCSGESTSVEDEEAVRCMMEVLRQVRYPAMSEEEVDMCGLLSFHYPVTFERAVSAR